MKKAFNFTLAFALMGMLFIASCSPEDDPEIKPEQENPREKFHGNWYVSENSKDYGASTYYCTISDSSVSPHILLAYLYSYHTKIHASVSDNNFTIPTQLIEGNNVHGSGKYMSATQLKLTYYVQTTSTHYDTITATLTK